MAVGGPRGTAKAGGPVTRARGRSTGAPSPRGLAGTAVEEAGGPRTVVRVDRHALGAGVAGMAAAVAYGSSPAAVAVVSPSRGSRVTARIVAVAVAAYAAVTASGTRSTVKEVQLLSLPRRLGTPGLPGSRVSPALPAGLGKAATGPFGFAAASTAARAGVLAGTSRRTRPFGAEGRGAQRTSRRATAQVTRVSRTGG